MADLERKLRALASAEEWPPTPDLAPGVVGRLEQAAGPASAAPGRSSPTPRRRRRRALAAALALLVALPGAALAFPEVRGDVLEWLGLRDVEVRRTPQPPPARELRPEPDLGSRVTLAQARRRVGFAPLVPGALGAPDEVRVDGPRVALVYREAKRIGVLITQQQGGEVIAEKLAGPGTTVERVSVDGAPGAWLAGEPHAILFMDARGRFREERLRLADDTLVWERDGLVLRVEGAASRERALAIARSLR